MRTAFPTRPEIDFSGDTRSRVLSALSQSFDFGQQDATLNGQSPRSLILGSAGRKFRARFDFGDTDTMARVGYERQYSNRHADTLGWPSVHPSRSGALAEPVRIDDTAFCVSIQEHVSQCHHVKSAADLTAFGTHLSEFYALKQPFAVSGEPIQTLDTAFLREEAVPRILSFCESPRWCAIVMDDLLEYVVEKTDPLEDELAHGDAHHLNFIIRPDQTGALVDTEFVCVAPFGYDLATAVWDLAACTLFDDVLFFCRAVATRVTLPRDVRHACAALMIFRMIWWLGLRISWLPGVPLKPRNLVESCLQFSLNVRMHERRIAEALANPKGPT